MTEPLPWDELAALYVEWLCQQRQEIEELEDLMRDSGDEDPDQN